MTTIAYRAGTLAADGLIAYNTITNGDRPKIARAGSYLVALAGPAWLRFPLEGWLSEGGPENLRNPVPEALLEHEDEFSAYIVDESGKLFEFCKGYLMPIYAEYAAIGSGGVLALGAMAHGASAEEAVRAACRHDKNSGGTVSALTVATLN